MKINTSELTGTALDWAVAQCEGVEFTYENHPQHELLLYNYSTDWVQGGSIIEREEIFIGKSHARGVWTAMQYNEQITCAAFEDGATPLIAAMRCYVASKLGNEIEIPKELK